MVAIVPARECPVCVLQSDILSAILQILYWQSLFGRDGWIFGLVLFFRDNEHTQTRKKKKKT